MVQKNTHTPAVVRNKKTVRIDTPYPPGYLLFSTVFQIGRPNATRHIFLAEKNRLRNRSWNRDDHQSVLESQGDIVTKRVNNQLFNMALLSIRQRVLTFGEDQWVEQQLFILMAQRTS